MGNSLLQPFIIKNVCYFNWVPKICFMFLFLNYWSMILSVKLLEKI